MTTLRQSLESPRNNSVEQTAAERLTTTSGSDFSSACIHSNTCTRMQIALPQCDKCRTCLCKLHVFL